MDGEIINAEITDREIMDTFEDETVILKHRLVCLDLRPGIQGYNFSSKIHQISSPQSLYLPAFRLALQQLLLQAIVNREYPAPLPPLQSLSTKENIVEVMRRALPSS